MNKEKFLVFFKKKSERKDEPDGIQITNVLTLATENVTSFNFKGAKNIRIKGVNDKHQITAIFGVSYTRGFLPIQGKSNEVCPSFLFHLLFR